MIGHVQMSLLSQISPTQFGSYVRTVSYEKLYQLFERPRDALGYRHVDPLTKVYNNFVTLCQMIIRPLFRIEISIRLKPE